MATKSLLLSRVIDAKENCSTMTLDVLIAFPQRGTLESASSKQTMLKIHRALVSMLCEIALEVCKDFTTCNKNDNKISHVSTFKLLCGILKVSIICY